MTTNSNLTNSSFNPMQIYFERGYVIIGYENSTQTLILKWLEKPSSQGFKEGMNALIHGMKQFETGKVITDHTSIGPILPDDKEWVANYWVQRAIVAGYSHIAKILHSDGFAQMILDDTLSKYTFRTAYFHTMEEAMAWMKEQSGVYKPHNSIDYKY